MSESRNDSLLIDFARLLAKYGPEAFELLARRIRDGSFQHDLLQLLETSAQVGRQTKRIHGGKVNFQKETTGLSELLRQCEADDPTKSDTLRQLHEKLMAKRILPSLRHIRDFAQDNGLPRIAATSREKAIIPLMRGMLALPRERIVSLLGQASRLEEKGERTLEGWTGVILSKRGRGSHEER